MENKIRDSKKNLLDMNQSQMDIYWNKVKEDEKA